MSNVKKRMDIYFDHRSPSIVVDIQEYRNGYIDIRKRGGKIRAFTEITKDNVNYCKELIKLVDELRHLNGVKGGLAVSESEYMATTVLAEAKPLTQVIFSRVKEVVEQGQYIFDTLWGTAIPAEQKIKEIEGGIVVPIRTRIIENQEEIIKEIKRKNNAASKLSICTGFGGMQMSYNYLFDSYKNVIDKAKKKEGGEEQESSGLRWITYIDRISLNLIKEFLQAGIDNIRHIKNMPPLSFGVSDKEVALTIEKMEGGKMSQSFLISNEPLYVNHFNSLFEELWKNGIDSRERIKDIEAGIDLADIDVIPSSAKAQDKYLDIVKSASEEILLILPTTSAFIRQDKIGAIPLAIQAARREGRNVRVRILVPANRLIEEKVQQLKEDYYCSAYQIDFRYIEQMSETRATILVVDRKVSLVMEIKDDSKTSFVEAIGLSTYSNSKAGILSYVAIFENLWKQSELYHELMKAYEQLKIHEKMQREFINIAAHELRTPIQPILGLTQVVCSRIKDTEDAELLRVVNRNAKRLQRLTEDILDVTRIESQSLSLNKEQFNLKDVIRNAIDDIMANKVSSYSSYSYSSSKTKTNNTTKLQYYNPKDIFVHGDKGRISQVILNLLDNALKFTKNEGDTITIMVEEQKKEYEEKQQERQYNNNNNHHEQQILVSIRDTGAGIDPHILPKLFSKFTTKSQTGGTGLGLFICKGIVEAHHGRIWAENNNDKNSRKGATFYFTLPLSVSLSDRLF